MLGEIEGRRRRGWKRMKWLDAITTTKDVSLSRLWELVMDREAWRAGAHGVTKSQTRLSNWTELNWTDLLQNRRVITNKKRRFWNGDRRFDGKEDLKKGKVRSEEKEKLGIQPFWKSLRASGAGSLSLKWRCKVIFPNRGIKLQVMLWFCSCPSWIILQGLT